MDISEEDSLDEEVVHEILLAGKVLSNRKKRETNTLKHKRRKKRSAAALLQLWKKTGVPIDAYIMLLKNTSTTFMRAHMLQEKVEMDHTAESSAMTIQSVYEDFQKGAPSPYEQNFEESHTPVSADEGEIVSVNNGCQSNTSESLPVLSPETISSQFNNEALCQVPANIFTDSDASSCEDDYDDGEQDDFYSTTAGSFPSNSSKADPITFKRILQHWAAYTRAKHSHLTYLLTLLKHYTPEPCYDSLPSTGQRLLYIDETDGLYGLRGGAATVPVVTPVVATVPVVTTAPTVATVPVVTTVPAVKTSVSLSARYKSATDEGESSAVRPVRAEVADDDSFDESLWESSSDESIDGDDSSFVYCADESSEGSSDESSETLTTLRHVLPLSSQNPIPAINPGTVPQSFSTNSTSIGKIKKRPKPLPKAQEMANGGKLIYFGIEAALSGDSPGNLFKYADLLQFVTIYKEDPSYLPECLISKIEELDEEKTMNRAKQVMMSGLPTVDPISNSRSTALPHFDVDGNIDGVWLFNNSEQGELIPILITVHSLRKSHSCSELPVVIAPSRPIVVGYFHGKGKPDVHEFLELFVKELDRLNPGNMDPVTTAGRQFTVILRCIRTDGPMRSYLKICKSHSGYWSCERCIQPGTQVKVKQAKKKLGKDGKEIEKKSIQFLELNAPLRLDEDYYTYHKGSNSLDDHLSYPIKKSPLANVLKMVTGFPIDPMHTTFGGALRRRLVGIVSIKHEGKLSVSQLTQIDARLKLIQLCCPIEFDRFVRSLVRCVAKYKDHELRQMLYYLMYPVFCDILQDEHLNQLMLLQQGMLLLGGFNPNPVPEDDVREASRLFKLYVQKQIDFGYPVRYTTHCLIHLPEDVATYQCGIECLSAFVYEDFQRIFRDMLVSGNKPAEQIRNRLIERSKYCLPTTNDGLLITTAQEFQKQAELVRMKKESGSNHFVIEFVDKGSKYPKILRFSKFTLTNRFPNNVCLMKNGSVLVCRDIVEFPVNSKHFLIVGTKFVTLENVYSTPFPSSKYHIYVASKMGIELGEWNVNGILGKMYALPYKYDECNPTVLPDITQSNSKWIVSPLFHTLY